MTGPLVRDGIYREEASPGAREISQCSPWGAPSEAVLSVESKYVWGQEHVSSNEIHTLKMEHAVVRGEGELVFTLAPSCVDNVSLPGVLEHHRLVVQLPLTRLDEKA